MFAQILEWLGDENRKAIVCGTSNVPEHLDNAFLRPGRFSYLVPFLYPDQRARLQILRIHLGLEGYRPRPTMDEASVSGILPRIASESELYAGADLEELVLRAKRAFFQSTDQVLNAEHLLIAHRDYRVSTPTRQSLLQHYRENLGPEFTNSMSLLGATDQRPQTQRTN